MHLDCFVLSGPTLPMVNGFREADDDCWSESSTLSNDSGGVNYSAAAAATNVVAVTVKPNAIVRSPTVVIPLIKPKERKGQLLQALTLPTPMKNALEDIGHTSKDNDNNSNAVEMKILAPKNPFEAGSSDDDHDEVSEINDRTLRSLPSYRDDQDETLKRNYSRLDREDTESTAPTVAIGYEGDRLAEVRPYAHVPGKRKAPRVPPDTPQPELLGAVALVISPGPKSSEAKVHNGLVNPKPKDLLVKPIKPLQEPVFKSEQHIVLNPRSAVPKEQPPKAEKPVSEPVLPLVEKPKEVVAAARPPEAEKSDETFNSHAKPEIVKQEVPDLTRPETSKPVPPMSNGLPADFFNDRFEPIEPVQSPKPWYKKKPFSFDKVIGVKPEVQDSGLFQVFSEVLISPGFF